MASRQLQIDRRRFLAQVSTAGALLAAHSWAIPGASGAGRTRERSGPRIRGLELSTAASLARMRHFYHGLLGLPVVDEGSERLTIAAGETRLTFLGMSSEEPGPFYHFAFNIPENKVLAAREWQKKRSPLLPIPERLRDPKYPDDVVHFRNWNAHSVFFFDPAGNVVEYIARHDLDNAAAGDFTTDDILYASEIAFVADDVAAVADKLQEVAGVGPYRRPSDQFAAVGDELGLLLVMKRGRVISLESPRKKSVSVFSTTAEIRGDRPATYAFPDFPYRIDVEA